MKISVVISEPLADAGESIGAFEWRVDPAEAEKEFRALRSRASVTRLWHGVEVPEESPEHVTAWLDELYWGSDLAGHVAALGTPARQHGKG